MKKYRLKKLVNFYRRLVKKRYNELMYDLEIFDLFSDEIREKWLKRTNHANRILERY